MWNEARETRGWSGRDAHDPMGTPLSSHGGLIEHLSDTYSSSWINVLDMQIAGVLDYSPPSVTWCRPALLCSLMSWEYVFLYCELCCFIPFLELLVSSVVRLTWELFNSSGSERMRQCLWLENCVLYNKLVTDDLRIEGRFWICFRS